MARIICVVDDAVKQDSGLWSKRGLAIWIEVEQGSVLFDTGETESVLSHNLTLLGLNPRDVNAVVLSHAHHDHTGGLEAVLSKNRGVPIYAHSDIFRPRYSFRQGAYQSIAMTLSAKDLASRAELRLSDLPMEIFPGLWTTGEILERPEPEGRSAHHAIRSDDHWRPDPYRDDLALVLETQAGLAVICGCCHAGLLNTLFHVQRTFERPILAILGGMHLVTADDLYLDHVVAVLKARYKTLRFYLNHCTGERAYQRLVRAFGNWVRPFPAGTVVGLNG